MKLPSRSFMGGCLVGVALTLAPFVLLLLLAAFPPRALKEKVLEYRRARLQTPQLPGGQQAAPWTFQEVGGGELRLEDLRGKVVFLTLFNPECPECLIELPFIQRLAGKLADAPVEFICASNEKNVDFVAWSAENDFILPVYTYDKAPESYGVKSVPTTFIIAPDGALAYAHTGALKWDDPACAEFIRALALKAVGAPAQPPGESAAG